jgi:hypothetical protein
MAVNTEVKGQLAKLLATENLNVEHRKITTAYFDVDRRVLALPIWVDVSNDVYDLLVGHEVGHALYTPKEDFGSAPKDFVNVLEDVRVERKMKVTYPGLKKSFYKGYTELMGRNFFGVDGRDLTTLSLIDRINLFFKIGSFTEIPFKEDEKVWLQRAVKTVTFRDVVDLSIELYEFMKSQKSDDKEDMPEMPLPQNGNQSAEEEQQPPSSPSSGGEGEEEEKEWFTDSDPETDHRADRDAKENADLDTPSYEHGGSEDDELESITDAASQKAQRDLVDDNAKEWIYLDLPKVNIKEIIRPYREVLNDLSTHFNRKWESETEQLYWDKGLEFQSKKYQEFKNSSVKTVNYMVKQFEMKKSADVYARAGVSRTGVVNTNSLYKYKLTDDIFKKVVTVPEGKNHGLIMYLDWSGSMSQGTPSGNLLSDTLKQTYNLVWFCKKVSIPFRVYAFNSGYGKEAGLNDQKMFELKDRSLGLNESFDLYELFSSKMKKAELEDQMRLLWTHVWGMSSYHISSHPRYSLGGTPLGEAVICTPEIVKSFRKTEGIDKVNVIILSDGESNPLSYVRECSYENYRWREDPEKLKDEGPWYRQDYLCHQYHKIFILRDPETRQTVRLNPEASYTTKEIVSFFNKITDYNWIGIRIGNKGDLTSILNQIPQYSLRHQYEKQWSKEKFCAIAEYGYDELYVFPSNNMGGGERDLDVKQKGESATAGELTRAFKKHMNSKMTNKSILNKFVEQIA